MRGPTARPGWNVMRSVCVEKLSSSAHLDRSSMVTTVRVEARVQRPLADLVELLQPESWTRSAYFRSVYRVQRTKHGQPVARQGRGDFSFERELVLAGNWTALYYEHVCAHITGGGSVEFHNLLDMDFEQADQYAALNFGLHECLASRWGVLRRSGGLDVDRGCTRLERQPGGSTYVDAVKSLRYAPFREGESGVMGVLGVSPHIANHLAPAFLGWWMEELVLGVCSAERPSKLGARPPPSSPLPDLASANQTSRSTM